MNDIHKELINKKFGYLTIKDIFPFYLKSKSNQKNYKAKVYCELCNREKNVQLRGILNKKTIACGCLKYRSKTTGLNNPRCKNLTNIKFNSLTALNISGRKNGRIYWKCICECGNFKDVATRHLTGNYIKSCGCKQSLKRELSNSWKGCGEISGKQWSRAKIGAKTRNLEFSISIEYVWELFLKQNKKCALSGLELKFGYSSKDFLDGTASLDRIDSSKGYIVGNVQWIHKKINIMKMDMPELEFINWCKIITVHKNENI